MYEYAWGNNPKRMTLKGRECVVLAHGKRMRSVLVQFQDTGQKEVISLHALKAPRTQLDLWHGA